MRTIVITGASRGIGLSTAQLFLRKGWQVIGTYNRNSIPLESDNLTSIHLDLASEESRDRALVEIKRTADSVDVLLNNAGVNPDGTDPSINLNKIRETFEVNLFALIDLTQRLLPMMQSGSHIVNMDSTYGAQSLPIDDKTSTGYRLSKAALNMYTRVLAFHLADQDITVSSIDPGWVVTDMGMSVATEDEKPDRQPTEVAQEIYELVNSRIESGQFWRSGQIRDW